MDLDESFGGPFYLEEKLNERIKENEKIDCLTNNNEHDMGAKVEKNSSGSEKDKMSMVLSFLALRRVIGILGILFPFLLVIGASIYSDSGIAFESSISSYFHTSVKHIFGGVLFVVAFFLFAYIGYKDNKDSISNCGSFLCKIDLKDNTVGNMACLFGLLLTLFPTTPNEQKIAIVGILHYIFAGCFFLCLIFFSLCLFTRSESVELDDDKRKRNMVYRICGYVMLISIILIPLEQCSKLFGGYEWLHDKIHYVFWLEAFALWAFGVSWFTKGRGERLALGLFRSSR